METAEAMERRGPTALARPSFIKEGNRGTENIRRDDIRPPALRMAQAMSPEAKRADPAYLEGLREGDLFNSLTREIYGDKPVHLLIVNYLGHRNVEFDPKDRKVVIDGNVPDGDPRTQFTTAVVEGKVVKSKPRAITFKDFLVLLIIEGRDAQLMTMTLKSTQLKKATRLLTLLKTSKLDTFAHLIKATPVPEHKGENSWFGWRFDVAGYPTEKDYLLAEKIYGEMQDKTVVVEVEAEAAAGDDAAEDVPF